MVVLLCAFDFGKDAVRQTPAGVFLATGSTCPGCTEVSM